MIESYHNQLKLFYLTRFRNKCVDRVIYTLVNVVLCDYRTEHIQMELGLKVMPLTSEWLKKKKNADEIELSIAQSMISLYVENDQTVSWSRIASYIFNLFKSNTFIFFIFYRLYLLFFYTGKCVVSCNIEFYRRVP
jgi:hypothetical protein